MNEEQTLPKCIGFIMDGNRRWAKERVLQTLKGHQQGHEVFKSCVHWLRDAGIEHGVFYAFSTENWGRSEEEVGYLMKLFESTITTLLRELADWKVRVRIIGQQTKLGKNLQTAIKKLEAESTQYTGTTIWIALSYGGRAEIVEAVNRAVQKGDEVSEVSFKTLLWSADMPDPDIIIRTSGEQRLSGFMTWSSVYSELYFVDTHWPALAQADFDDILAEYGNRKRRRGK